MGCINSSTKRLGELRSSAVGVVNGAGASSTAATGSNAGVDSNSLNISNESSHEVVLKAPPLGRLLVLDLQSEQFPQYERTHSFHGQPFIWCMLHNFGGTLGMHGSANIVNTQIEYARQMPNSTLIGVGITPEGINQNYVMYALTLERAWSKQFKLQHWFTNYSQARYESGDDRLSHSWQLLRQSVYAFNGLQRLRGKYVLTTRPSLNLNVWLWYNPSDIYKALSLMLDSDIKVNCTEIFLHDVVDLTRQWLQLKLDHIYVNLLESFHMKQLQRLQFLITQFLLVFDDLDILLASDERFLLGRWQRDAKKLAANRIEESIYNFNALNQVTTWGPKGQILDYANKQWSGLVSDYYKARWQLFTQLLEKSVREDQDFNATAFRKEVSEEIELPFSTSLKEYPAEAKGDVLKIARTIFKRWSHKFHDPQFLQHLKAEVKMIITILSWENY